MVEFVDASSKDLLSATLFLHSIKPSLKSMFVYGIEKHKPEDRSIVFHMINLERNGEEKDLKDTQLFILSAEYILEHPIWKGFDNDRSD